jgi:hypothetical protein
MKPFSIVLKILLALLVFITLSTFVAAILLDSARDTTYHIVLYLFAALALIVGIGNSYGGYLTVFSARKRVQPTPWYQHYRLTYGMVLLLGLLALLYKYCLSSKLPPEMQAPITLGVFVGLGIPYLILSILSTWNKYRT